MDQVQQGRYYKDQEPIFSQYGPKQSWLIKINIMVLEMLREYPMISWINYTINFKCTILIESQCSVCSSVSEFSKENKEEK